MDIEDEIYFEPIDLSDLVDFLNSDLDLFELDSHHMQIIEEVVYLCINPDFLFDVHVARSEILRRFPKMNIPSTNTDQTKNILNLLAQKFNEEYKKKIRAIVKKYKLLPSLYWKDHFGFTPLRVKELMSRGKDKKTAQFYAYEESENTLLPSILDSVIIQNTVFDKREVWPHWLNPYFTRKLIDKNYLNIEIEKDNPETVLKILFPPYSTLSEMKQMLSDNYKKIQKMREKELPVLAKRDHRKDALPKMIDAYTMERQGLDIAKISYAIDKKYGGDSTFEGIDKLITRLKEESSRFNRDR
jgi:hypothetical protein